MKNYLSFNITTIAGKQFMFESNYPVQIMPERTRMITQSKIDSFEHPKQLRNVLIHTSFTVKLFKQLNLYDNSKLQIDLVNYIKLAYQLHTKDILIHGPSSLEEYKTFDEGLKFLSRTISLCKTKSIKFCIEIPSFAKSLLNTITDYKTFMIDYTKTIVNNGFDVVFDTAHLFANGLNAIDMTELLIQFKENYKWIHLNGNCREQFNHDKHTPIIYPTNKIENSEALLECISKQLNGKFMICEIQYHDKKYWIDICKKYNFGFNSKALELSVGGEVEV